LRQFLVEREAMFKCEQRAPGAYSISLGPEVYEVAFEAFLPGGQ
jgi:hypothetical protein